MKIKHPNSLAWVFAFFRLKISIVSFELPIGHKNKEQNQLRQSLANVTKHYAYS
jgi:hypothetical protein